MNPIDPNKRAATAPTGADGGTPTGNGGGVVLTPRELKLRQIIADLEALAGIPQNLDTTKKAPKVPNPYGKQTESFINASLTTVNGCPGPFQRNTGLADRLTNNGNQFSFLSDYVLSMSASLRRAKFWLGECTGEVVDDVGNVVKTRDTVMDNPNGAPEEQTQMGKASKMLQQLRSGRAAGKAGRAKGTKAADANAATADTKIANLEVENKYLAGQELVPDDIIRAATVNKGGKGKNAPAPATTASAAVAPARRTARSGGARKSPR